MNRLTALDLNGATKLYANVYKKGRKTIIIFENNYYNLTQFADLCGVYTAGIKTRITNRWSPKKMVNIKNKIKKYDEISEVKQNQELFLKYWKIKK